MRQFHWMRWGIPSISVCLFAVPLPAVAQGRFANQNPQALVRTFAQASDADREDVAKAIFDHPTEAAAGLREMLSSTSVDERKVACDLLAQLRDVASVESLIKATYDSDREVGAHATSALRVIGDRRAAARLRELVANPPTPGILRRALVGIGKLGESRDVRLVRPYLAHGDESVRVIAAAVLAMLGNGEGEDILLSATRSSDPAAQKDATAALGYIDSPSARQRLSEILADPNGAWKSYAAIGQALQVRRGQTNQAQVTTLESLAHSGDRILAGWALDELTDSTQTEATAALHRLAARDSRIGRRAELRLRAKEGRQ